MDDVQMFQYKRPRMFSNTCFKSFIKKEFIPFQQERDNIGRLIKKSLDKAEHHQLIKDQLTSLTEEDQKNRQSQSNFQKKLSKYFKEKKMVGLGQPKKSKNKKTFIFTQPAQIQIKKVELYNLNNLQKRNSIVQKCNYDKNRLTETTASNFRIQPKKRPLTKMKSTTLPKNNPPDSDHRLSEGTEHQKSHFALMKNTLPVNLSRFNELDHYHRMQQLELKAYNNFEQGHMRFIGMMKKSKQLAFEVRNQLQRIDDDYY